MLEAIQCPACSTRYRLRRERVQPRHVRARCYACQGEFPIQAQVAALLGLPPIEAQETRIETALEPSDLLMGGDDILDKTLVTAEPIAPEDRYPTAPLAELADEEERTSPGPQDIPSEARTTGSYRSAKDAISQLFGDAPAPESPRLVRQTTPKSSLELEATLEALENTLGGTPPAMPPEAAPGPTPMEDLPPSSTATQRMSLAELQAAATSMPPAKELEAAEVTEMMGASRMARQMPADPAATHPVGSMLAPGAPASDDPNLLRLRIGEDIYPNLAMDQLIRWVEEGRVLENHLVARQFSENWIEAYKVPGLRPVFERLKRLRESVPVIPIEGAVPAKKSLFGGLFGKKD